MTSGRWAALVSLAVVAGASAQERAPGAVPEVPGVDFHVEVNYVEVDARVLDGEGRFVRDLTRDDFEVFEDGVPQAIDRFALVDIPLEQPEKPAFVAEPIEADSATNAREFDGRLYLIVLDDLHVAPLRTQLARRAAREFIETRIGVNDQAAVVTTRGSSFDMQAFTGNRRLLLDAVDNFVGRKLQSEAVMAVNAPDVVNLETQETRFAPGPDRIQRQRAQDANAAMLTLRNAAEFMAGVRGRRKALLYISEGIDYDVYDAFGNPDSSDLVSTSHDAVAAATRANVAVYAVDPRGLTALGDDIAELGGQPAGANADTGARSLLREQQTSHDSLRELSDLTGGFAVVNVGEASSAFDRIVEENSAYYVLAYYTANTRRQGKSRDLEVRVRRPGVRVLSRDSYIEPRADEAGRQARPAPEGGEVPTDLLDVLRSPLPLGGLTMSATAAAFKGEGGTASVAVVVELRGSELGLLRENDRHTGTLEVGVWAVSVKGGAGVSARRQTRLNLGADSHDRVSRYGLKVVLRLDLTPGRYQIRVGALTPATGLRGSVFYDLDVPDYTEAPLAMSNVVLTSARSSRVLTTGADERLSEQLPAAPTAMRVFPTGDQLDLLAEVYDNDPRPHQVDISSSVFTSDGQLIFRTVDTRENGEFGRERIGTYGVGIQVPLAAFEPGLYVLRVQAESRLGAPDPAVREVQFRIRDEGLPEQ